jgi:Zn-dependent peptidase ImmA (M78 family)
LGLRVKYADLGRRSGEVHSSGLVVINHTKSLLTQRVTLAHECGHWVFGHDWTDAHDRGRDETQADTYAARLLISAAEYADAERTVGAHPGALARELNVTPKLIELWRQDYLSRVGVVRATG